MYELAGTYALMAEKVGVEIRTSVEVTPEYVEEEAPDANVRHRPLLLKEIDRYVTVHTGYRGLEVTKEGVLCEDSEKNQVLVPGSTVVCALGLLCGTGYLKNKNCDALHSFGLGESSLDHRRREEFPAISDLISVSLGFH